MKQNEYKVLGHKVKYNVPENSAEFNLLDPKRPDAACEEATSNIVYRGMNPETRYTFLHGRDAVEAKDGKPGVSAIVGVEAETEIPRKTKPSLGKDGKARVKDGVEVTVWDESEEVYYNRVLATLVETKKYASEDAARAHFDPLIVSIAAEVPFDVTQAERSERGPLKLAEKYKKTAAMVITNGTLDRVNSNQLAKIGKSFTLTNDTTKMYAGSVVVKEGEPAVTYNVSDKDAEALGRLIKEYQDWKADQERNDFIG